MKPIQSIEALTDILDQSEKSERPTIMKNLKIDGEEIQKFSTWSKEGYTRNCLARTEAYEIILLCWDKASETPIHGHGGQDCWVYQVQGDVEELRYERNKAGDLKETQKLELSEGGLSYMNDDMGYHLIRNAGDTRAMTLHIYAAPIDACEVFDEQKEQFEVTEMEYDSVAEELVN